MNKKQNFNYKNLTKAQNQKKRRLYKRIFFLINQFNCMFLTLTFNNKTLIKTNKQTRLRYIKKYLNEQASNYILNCDYGKTTKREHYHAIITPKNNKLKIDFSMYKYGFIRADKINKLTRFKKNNKSIEEITNDLLKHCIKENTNESKIIYSRALKTNI